MHSQSWTSPVPSAHTIHDSMSINAAIKKAHCDGKSPGSVLVLLDGLRGRGLHSATQSQLAALTHCSNNRHERLPERRVLGEAYRAAAALQLVPRPVNVRDAQHLRRRGGARSLLWAAMRPGPGSGPRPE